MVWFNNYWVHIRICIQIWECFQTRQKHIKLIWILWKGPEVLHICWNWFETTNLMDSSLWHFGIMWSHFLAISLWKLMKDPSINIWCRITLQNCSECDQSNCRCFLSQKSLCTLQSFFGVPYIFERRKDIMFIFHNCGG